MPNVCILLSLKVSKLEEKSVSVTRIPSLSDNELLEDICLGKFKLSEQLHCNCGCSDRPNRVSCLSYFSLHVTRGNYWKVLQEGNV